MAQTPGRTLLHQMVSFPDHSEDIRVVYGAEPNTDPSLPEDATLTGYIFTYAEGQVVGTRLDLFYSSSWRTWFPLPEKRISEEEPCYEGQETDEMVDLFRETR